MDTDPVDKFFTFPVALGGLLTRRWCVLSFSDYRDIFLFGLASYPRRVPFWTEFDSISTLPSLFPSFFWIIPYC